MTKERSRKKMAATIAEVKHLKGDQATKFIKAFETSKIRDEAISKAMEAMKKGFTKRK